MNRIVTFARPLLLLALIVCWIANFPYHEISAFVGAHFPWPTTSSWRGLGLLAEGALVQLTVALPAAAILALSPRRWAFGGALALCAIFSVQTIITLGRELALNSRNGVVFALYLGVCHVLILLGGLTLFLMSRPDHRLERP